MLDIQHTDGARDLIESFLATGAASLMTLGAARWHLLRIDRTRDAGAFATAVVAREGSHDAALSVEFEAPLIMRDRGGIHVDARSA